MTPSRRFARALAGPFAGALAGRFAPRFTVRSGPVGGIAGAAGDPGPGRLLASIREAGGNQS